MGIIKTRIYYNRTILSLIDKKANTSRQSYLDSLKGEEGGVYILNIEMGEVESMVFYPGQYIKLPGEDGEELVRIDDIGYNIITLDRSTQYHSKIQKLSYEEFADILNCDIDGSYTQSFVRCNDNIFVCGDLVVINGFDSEVGNTLQGRISEIDSESIVLDMSISNHSILFRINQSQLDDCTMRRMTKNGK